MNITFKPLKESDFQLIYTWIQQPHIKQWWSDPEEWDQFVAKYQQKITSEYRGCFIILSDTTPIGYIQWYNANKFPEWPHEPEGTYGMDLFIGNPDFLGKGLGTEIVKLFTQMLFKKPAVKRIIINPDVNNLAAIRCYQKAGFVTLGKIPERNEILMELKRK